MRKRRRNITIINNEIDYDKLTKAIVDANVQKMSKTMNIKTKKNLPFMVSSN